LSESAVTSPAAGGPSAGCSRVAVHTKLKALSRSWCASDWRESYECQSSAVFWGGRRWRGSNQPGSSQHGRAVTGEPRWRPLTRRAAAAETIVKRRNATLAAQTVIALNPVLVSWKKTTLELQSLWCSAWTHPSRFTKTNLNGALAFSAKVTHVSSSQ